MCVCVLSVYFDVDVQTPYDWFIPIKTGFCLLIVECASQSQQHAYKKNTSNSSSESIEGAMNLSMKYITTFSLFFCYFVYGVNFYVIGPTLIELAGLFHTTIEKIAFIYTMRSAGYTIGSLSGFLFNYLNRQLMFVIFLATMGITLSMN